MDSHARPPDSVVPAAAASRKRNGTESDTDSDDTMQYYVSSEESDDDTFELVRSRKAKRRFVSTSSNSSASTMRSSRITEVLTILFTPVLATDNLRCLNRQAVSTHLEALVPNEIKDIRVNTRKNVVAIDVEHAAALDSLRKVTELDGIKVHPHIPLGKESSTGVIYDVDETIADTDLSILIKPATENTVIANVFRLGTSRCVKIVFKGESLPTHVKVGHFRHAVRPFVPKPLQCWKCMKLGHVSSVCKNTSVCSRCTGPHTTDTCEASVLKCTNCSGPHDASSKECPLIRKEMAILKKMVRDNSSHREAAASIKRRRSRRRRRSRTSKASVPREPRTSPPPLPPRPNAVSSKDKGASNNTAADAWPELPRLHAPTEREQTSTARDTSSVPDKLTDQDQQIVVMLSSLVSALRVLLDKLQTPTARSALQVLDAINPVLASLQKSSA